jgi:two-component system phosphate regulon sensor histidine kinase PhoR
VRKVEFLSRVTMRRLRQGAAPLGAAVAVLAILAALGVLPVWAAVVGCGVVLAATLLVVPAETEAEAAQLQSAAGSPPVSALIGALSEPAILLTGRGSVLEFNKAARELLGSLREGDPVSFALRVPEVLEGIRSVGAGGPGRLVEYNDRVPVGRWIEARIDPVRIGRDGGTASPDFVLLILHDSTHLRRAERMRVDFVANASHELRTPLAALLGFIETLQGPARNDADARVRFLEIMRGQANRMSRLVDDLLSLSRIEQKQHVRPVDPVDLVEIVRTVLDSLSPLAAERDVEITTFFPEQPLIATGDRDELIRVVENLVENGIKYGQSGKRVEVSVVQAANGARSEAHVVVQDFGPGIAAEHLPRLTERFYRIDAGKSREKGGTGLGLAIVKHIMARHRGRLVIESPAGQGARFTAALEAVAGPVAAQKAERREKVRPEG